MISSDLMQALQQERSDGSKKGESPFALGKTEEGGGRELNQRPVLGSKLHERVKKGKIEGKCKILSSRNRPLPWKVQGAWHPQHGMLWHVQRAVVCMCVSV